MDRVLPAIQNAVTEGVRERFRVRPGGLTSEEAKRRLARPGQHELASARLLEAGNLHVNEAPGSQAKTDESPDELGPYASRSA